MVEAKGLEEMVNESRDSRKEKSIYNEAIVVEGIKGGGMSREIGSVIETAMVLFSPPDHAKFNQLYAEANTTNMISSKVEQNKLTISTPTYNLSMDIRTVMEIIAQKMRTPLNLPMELNLNSSPPFISNIKEVCNFWISEMLCEYQKIFRLNDPIVQKICHEYWLSMSYPLLVRLAYVEWENKQMDWKVGLKVKDIAAEFTAKNRQIQSDYEKKLDTETTILKTKHNRTEMENQALKTQVNMINERYNNLKQDEANRVGEVEDAYNKLKDEKASVSLLEKEIIRLKDENKELKGQIKADEDEEEWKPDVTSTPEQPVYRNKELGKTLKFPCPIDQFKKEYKLKTQGDNSCKYESSDGKEFEIPNSLVDKLVDNICKTTPENKKMEAEAEKLYKNNPKWDEIRKFIESVGGEASTSEIAIGIKGNASNIRKQYLKEMEDKGLIAGEQVGKEKRYTLSM